MSERRSGVRWCLGVALAALAVGAGVAGCGQNACDRAAQHEIDCQVTTESAGSSSGTGGKPVSTDCSGLALCEATCLAAAPCSELQEFNDPTKAKPLKFCLEECVKNPDDNPQAHAARASNVRAD